jgi:hypothetical protein
MFLLQRERGSAPPNPSRNGVQEEDRVADLMGVDHTTRGPGHRQLRQLPVAQQPGQRGCAVIVIEVLLVDDRGTSAILIVPRSRRWPAVSVNRIAPADWGITGR